MSVVETFIEGLRLGGEMFWETWWALVLGFTIAGAVEAFVSEEQMTQVLGGSGWRELGLGSLFGAASSSCSFGAVATTKSLFKKGASPVASLAAFQFASTNLVIELGLVMWILLGWEFVIADYVAGSILIVLFAAILEYAVPDAWFRAAREHLQTQEGVRDPTCGMGIDPTDTDVVTLERDGGTEYFCSEACKRRYQNQEERTWTERLLTIGGWKEASRNAIGEWQMLWKDIAAGFLVAGLIGAFVPRAWWTTLFGIGAEGTLGWVAASAVIGVIVGIITFVCSVGNVPFAVILWNNGIAFGGVMSFIFADLIVPTIDDAYRRYYGLRLAGVLFVSIFVTAVIVGVIIHFLWGSLGLIPPQGQAGGTAPRGYTTWLNAGFTVVFAIQAYLMYGSRSGEVPAHEHT
ncbi:permease (plasmid) [Haloferax mediterranei ATCC 33500]|uniref:Permease n=1 Tax=Haloferax mediterranei (strain ATCC 33500 / DSM 1411 / JCM 8866 / NBRC 14739 / NCIMB 2177 / R-4) TaxID=523841 RepID=I3R9Y3_HALMT|nr:permease [Haloferax mediterranei]AFK21043.1 putative metal ion permease [Haloferax mediterranei ATCC 33500]AHZ24097.1 permease [Haloferax mediterranei ATCC 33500]EMA05172.1 putative metal ion permease [Haloferax mediterranei ATCC 33500]MDX5989753.1 permease [Haloferax mediterranei ATCC 33500]QCQ77203.1 permease [Haloferax mediterranei ATCC 33500]